MQETLASLIEWSMAWASKIDLLSASMLTTNFLTEYHTLWYGTVTKVIIALKSVAAALIVIFCLIGIFKAAGSLVEFKRPEAIVRVLIRLIFAEWIVNDCWTLMHTALKVSIAITGIVTDAVGADLTTVYSMPAAVSTALDNTSWWSALIFAIPVMLLALVFVALHAICLVKVYGRIFKVLVYGAIAPLPLASFASESTQGAAVSFIKEFLGVCLEATVIVLALIFAAALTANGLGIVELTSSSTVVGVVGWLVEQCLVAGLMLMTVMGASQMARSLIG